MEGPTLTQKVQRYATSASFPTNGQKGVIYIDESTGDLYTWSGSAYVASTVSANELSEILANGNTTGGTDIDFEDDKAIFGDNTEISEVSGDTLIQNSSATNDIIEKLGDAAGATEKKVVDSADVTLHSVKSDGEIQAGKLGEAGVAEVKDASNVVQERLNPIGDNYGKGLSIAHGKITLADDASTTVASATAGFGFCNIGDNQEYVLFSFSTTSVTLISNSANVANSDSDTDLCIYFSGADLLIKNRLTAELDARFTIWSS